MNFELTPQQKAVQQSARQFAQTVLQETVLEDDAAGRFPEEAYKKMGEMESEVNALSPPNPLPGPLPPHLRRCSAPGPPG